MPLSSANTSDGTLVEDGQHVEEINVWLDQMSFYINDPARTLRYQFHRTSLSPEPTTITGPRLGRMTS